MVADRMIAPVIQRRPCWQTFAMCYSGDDGDSADTKPVLMSKLEVQRDSEHLRTFVWVEVW